MTGKSDVKRILKISYLYKLFTICITVLIMSSSLVLIYEGINFYKQKEFFKEHENYSYVDISVDNFEKTQTLRFNHYKEKLTENKVISLVDLHVDEKTNYIFADNGAINYLKNNLPEVRDIQLEHKVYFFAPEEQKNLDAIKDVWEMYYPYPYKYEFYTYKNNIEVLSVEKSFFIKSNLHKNPIIILNNIEPEKIEMYFNDYIYGTTMFLLNDKEWNTFVKTNNLEDAIVYKTNVYDNYIYQWNFMKRGILIGVVLSLLLLILEGIIIKTILSQEYNFNAIELTLKKIMGYNIFNRYKTLLVTNTVSGLVGITISLITNYFLNISSTYYILIGGLLVVVIELIVFSIYVYKLENKNIQVILKGSSL